VIELGSEAVTAIDADDAVEVGGFAELERDRYLYRDVSGPPDEMAQVFAVVEHAIQESVSRDLFRCGRRDRADAWDLADLAGPDVLPASLHDFVADQHD